MQCPDSGNQASFMIARVLIRTWWDQFWGPQLFSETGARTRDPNLGSRMGARWVPALLYKWDPNRVRWDDGVEPKMWSPSGFSKRGTRSTARKLGYLTNAGIKKGAQKEAP